MTAGSSPRRWGIASAALLGLWAYVPLLLSDPGRLNADTKSYLYIDPGRLMARAASVWDPAVGMGTVSHQIIGYLWPMGPFFWLAEFAGIGDWVAQRLWLGTVLFAAGLGVLFLLRQLGFADGGALVAAAAYMLSPYTIAFAARASVLLLPWAGLPWLTGLVMLSLRRGGWRYPALFAVVTTTVGSVNASSLLFAVAAAFLWVPYAVWIGREQTLRVAVVFTARAAALTLACNLWWAVALVIGGSFGVPVLRATETIEAVSRGSTATEVLRSLGNWFFYGSDRLGPWVEASVPYTQHAGLIVLSFLLPALALASAAFVPWRGRAYFVTLLAVGTTIAVGAYPYAASSPYGAVMRTLADTTAVGMALRNGARATPMVALAMACFLGAGVRAVSRRIRGAPPWVTTAVVALAVLNLPVIWQAGIVDPNLSRPEELPDYWLAAARHLDERGRATRVLEIPGADFAAYRWGNTVDPITPGLIDRPWVARESLPVGSVASVNLLTALDRRMQEGVWEPSALAPLSHLMGVGDVVVRSDLQFERYRTPRPRPFWAMTAAASGLGPPVTFGPPEPNRASPRFPLLDEIELGTPSGTPHPPPVTVFPVADAVPIVRAVAADRPVIVAGDGEGLVDLAGAHELPDEQLILYAGSLSTAQIDAAIALGAELVVTDSNRRRAQRWTIVRENYGYTEQAGETPLVADPSDGRFDLFPGDDDASRTVAEHRGVQSVRASTYGNTISYTPEDRPVLALDGDVRTAWRTGGFEAAIGERLVVDFGQPVEADRIRVVQPQRGQRNRWITDAILRFDDDEEVAVTLDPASRLPEGQELEFGPRRFQRLELVIAETNLGRRADYRGASAVGIAELVIPGVRVEEVLRLPTRLLDLTGRQSAEHALTIALSRARANPAEPVRWDEEIALARTFSLPTPRQFQISGTARLSAERDDATLDRLLGRPTTPVHAQSNGRLPGDVSSRASKALDGDLATWWQPGLLDQEGHALDVTFASRRRIDGLDLVVVADRRHSVATKLVVVGDGGERRVVDVPPVEVSDDEGATVSVPVAFEPFSTRTLRVEIAAVDATLTPDYFTEEPVALPVAIAELGVGVTVSPLPAELPGTCRDDLLAVDGHAVAVRVTGATADAEARGGLQVELCGPDAGGVDLAAGEHVVRTTNGFATGLDIDRLVLRSPAAGSVLAPTPPPAVRVRDEGRTRLAVDVVGAQPGTPFWLVLGQSHSEGWRAALDKTNLGTPTLVNGFANGWLVEPPAGQFTIDLEWRPQRWVWLAIAVSALANLLCLALAILCRPELAGDTRRVPPLRLLPQVRLGVVGVVVVFGLVVATPAVAVVGGATTAAAAWVPPTRRYIRAFPALLVATAGSYVAIQQWRYDYPAAFEWPIHFSRVHQIGWMAIVVLVGITVVDGLARHLPTKEQG